ncbi:hypothetical protein BFJ69_g15665 [Fusarium oxysporum]|uniref:Uncharacterized protein n=1 Tax=Fusarium oxysporum TaxID=5507 RepID=A0A420MDM2_FUSOX|nr:hypothetical protein BFJ69_g15665 [Fusarium oxysporum]
MGRGDVPCHIIGKVFDENQQIMDLVDELAAEKEQNKAQLQRILDRIYRNIARYGDASEGKQSVEAYVYDGWRGLLNTIKATLRLLGTDFYEDDTADEGLADLYELCTEADDVLLGALRKIWIYDKENYKLYTGPKPRWHSEGTGLDPDWNWKLEGNAKPIMGGIPYTIDLLDDRGDTIDDWVYVFRRSWQFCLDAQQIAEGNLGNQRQELLNTILLRHRIPREIHREILSYLTDREPFPYLKKLDIGAAYTPFPTVGERCLECEHLDETSAIKRTCPQAGLYLWNLALRRFHSFHKNGFNQWSLCSHGSDCKGHHDCNDHSWAVRRDPEFTQFIEKEASRDNDEFLSLDQLGLGPVQRIRLDVAKDRARHERLKDGNLIYSEPFRDWHMVGGLGGLVDSMLHGRVLWKAWNEGPQEAGTHSEPAKWAVGRNLLAQRVAEMVIKDLHSWPGRCEWCE